jgi:hypothetical protein
MLRDTGRIPATVSPAPTNLVLGSRPLGTATNAMNGFAALNAVLKQWGWRLESFDDAHGVMRTGWLYVSGAEFLPSSGQQCADANTIAALRLTITERTNGAGSTEFVAQADPRVREG